MFLDRFMHGAIIGGVLVTNVIVGGCTSVEHSFLGYDSLQVWTAMVAVARTPTYDDWKVAANDVWVDETAYRIEVYRHLRRVLYSPDANPHRESQTWRFEISLVEFDPPLARLVSRGIGQPTDAQREAKRYFRDVHDLLLGVPTEATLTENDDLLESFGADETMPETADDRPDVPAVEFVDPDGPRALYFAPAPDPPTIPGDAVDA